MYVKYCFDFKRQTLSIASCCSWQTCGTICQESNAQTSKFQAHLYGMFSHDIWDSCLTIHQFENVFDTWAQSSVRHAPSRAKLIWSVARGIRFQMITSVGSISSVLYYHATNNIVLHNKFSTHDISAVFSPSLHPPMHYHAISAPTNVLSRHIYTHQCIIMPYLHPPMYYHAISAPTNALSRHIYTNQCIIMPYLHTPMTHLNARCGAPATAHPAA